MPKVWKYGYKGHIIEVIDGEFAELIIDGEVQDRLRGLVTSALLTGRLKSGEEIKVRLGGNLKIQCDLFINNKLQKEI